MGCACGGKGVRIHGGDEGPAIPGLRIETWGTPGSGKFKQEPIQWGFGCWAGGFASGVVGISLPS
jgi:hypothetical protein